MTCYEWLSYDANGNIMTLNRNGISDSPSNLILIDDLAYEYDNNNSNLLINVTDATNNDAGFKKGNPSGDNDFKYDSNGNLIRDWNKGITEVKYNHLNLPVKVTFDNASNKYIEYLYTATGQKVEKKVKHQDSLSYTRYSQGFQYFDDVLQFYHIPEGYVKNTPTETGAFGFDYVYNYVDHLGNVRMSYAQDPQTGALKILEENHYYPFGLKHTHYTAFHREIKREEEVNEKKISERPPSMPLTNPGYNYKFNGMELQSEFGVNVYDFGARNYDPALGRWMNIDPLAEKMRRHSPYNYAFNNPIYFIDPDGMEAEANNSASAASGGGNFSSASSGIAAHSYNSVNIKTTYQASSGAVSASSGSTGGSEEEGKSSSIDQNQASGGGCPQPCPDDMPTPVFDFDSLDNGGSPSESSSGGNTSNSKDITDASNLLTVGGFYTELLKAYAKENANIVYKYGSAEVSAFENTLQNTKSMTKLASYAKWGGRFLGAGSLVLNRHQYIEAVNNNDVLGQKRSKAEGFANFVMLFGPIGLSAGVGAHISLGLNPTMEHQIYQRNWEQTCFIAGTKITLKDGLSKNIEDIVVGEEILSVNINTMEIEVDYVMIVPRTEEKYNQIYMKYSNGVETISSPHHPFYVKDKGWAVYDIELARKDLNFDVKQLEIGDVVYYYDNNKLKEIKIIDIKDKNEDTIMYNIKYVKKNNTFFANGILVHNRYNN